MKQPARSLRMLRKVILLGLALAMCAPRLMAQDDAAPRQRGQGGGQFAGMQRATGEVTAVSGATVSIKTETGAAMQIVTTDNTRIMKGHANQDGSSAGGTIKVSDLKVGDGVMATGNLDAPNKTLHAAVLFATDAAQVKALKENLGKTYMVGKVTNIDIDNARLTVTRSDGVSQTIGLDESTSFRRGRANAGMLMGDGGGRQRGNDAPVASAESITLADIKVGDNIAGKGSLKGGVFVPTEVIVGSPGQRRTHNATPDTTAPGTLR